LVAVPAFSFARSTSIRDFLSSSLSSSEVSLALSDEDDNKCSELLFAPMPLLCGLTMTNAGRVHRCSGGGMVVQVVNVIVIIADSGASCIVGLERLPGATRTGPPLS
jgi:hypothetical protein